MNNLKESLTIMKAITTILKTTILYHAIFKLSLRDRPRSFMYGTLWDLYVPLCTFMYPTGSVRTVKTSVII